MSKDKKKKTEEQTVEQPVCKDRQTDAQEQIQQEEVKQEEVKQEEAPAEKSEADALKEELAATKDKYLRLAAEYDNYRRRSEKEKQMIYADATSDTLKEILTIGDSLERASAAYENASEEYKKGVDMIITQYFTALKKIGAEPFGEVGDKFDPSIHNAISVSEDESAEDNTITAVYQTGYKIGDKIVRHAMVQVRN